MLKFKGTRAAYSTAVMELAEKDPRVMVVSPDALKAMRATDFAEKFPDRCVECGIGEQGAVDVAAGLAACGYIPFVGTYAGFLTLRAAEQMRTFVGYPDLNVKFCGVNTGIFGGEREGVTHQFYEDMAVVSSLPNYTIFSPADPEQCYRATYAAYEIEGPVYIRAGSGREVEVYPEDAPFAPDGITIWRDYGNDAVIFSTGFFLDRVIAAADLLKERGVNVTAADINILYGKDDRRIVETLKKSDRIFTVEDHNINGGLGSYISRLACEKAPRYVTRIALTTYGESGPAKEIADAYGFSPEAIAETVLKGTGR
ncbi:MAG: transketolase [Firmicutes bacterium]|nr:transketolase [Bacillota bacterium]